MNKSIAEMLKKGYILFPKVLFEEQMKMTKNATGSFEAFILVLTHVNYSTVTCRVNGQTFECRRGESVISLTHWAKVFGWKLSRTRRFFDRMYEEGIIERVVNPYITHIRIPDYDLLIGQRRNGWCHLRGFLGEISRGNPETKGQYRPCQTGMEETFSPRTQYEHTAD